MPRGKHGNHVRGSKHHSWNNGRMQSSHGYTLIRVGRDHPLANKNGYAYEHLLVWVSAGNPKPAPGQVIHHVNHDPANNRLDNLRLVWRSEHNAHHNVEKGRDEAGRFASA